MKRFAAHIGLTTFCALAVAFYLSETLTLILMLSFTAIAIVSLLIKKTRRHGALPTIAIVAAISFGVNLVYTAAAVKPIVDHYCGKEKWIEATLTDEPYRQYAKYYYPLTTDSIDREDVRVKILLKTNSPIDIEPFDSVSLTADVSPTENQYYLSKGFYITVDTFDSSFNVTEKDSKPLYYHVIRLRQSMRDVFDDYLPMGESALCKAILIGDKTALDQSVKEDFRYIGGSYFIVVSGMHFSVIVTLCLWLFRKVFRKRFIYFPLTYLVILLYIMITGFQPSVMRSGVMMIILVTGQLMRRISDPLTSLGIAGLMMPLIFSPYGCGDMGMILSFAATFSIIVWQPPIYEKLRIKKDAKHRFTRILIKMLNAILSVISVSLAANILTLPLSVYFFKAFSPITVITALLLYPLIWLILVLSLLVCGLYYLGPIRYAALLLSWPLFGIARLILWLVGWLSEIPFAYIHVKSVYFYVWVTLTLILVIAVRLLRGRYRLLPYAVLLSTIVFFGGFVINTVIRLNTDRLIFDAGKSGAMLTLDRGGMTHLLRFDCDSSSAYKMFYRLQDDYGGAYTAVCTSAKERINYNRLSDKEFPVTHYLVSQQYADYCPDEPDIVFSDNAVFVLDDGVILYTIEDNGKTLLYLNDNGNSILQIPSGFSFDAIPDEYYQANIILLNKPAEDYDRLSCETLILCDAADQSNGSLPRHNSLFDLSDKHMEFTMN